MSDLKATTILILRSLKSSSLASRFKSNCSVLLLAALFALHLFFVLPVLLCTPSTETAQASLAIWQLVLHAICYMLHATCYMLYAICYMLHAICYMLHAVCYMLYATCYMLYAVCYMLHATCCMLHAICYMLYAICYIKLELDFCSVCSLYFVI
jgi:hypothetical protein